MTRLESTIHVSPRTFETVNPASSPCAVQLAVMELWWYFRRLLERSRTDPMRASGTDLLDALPHANSIPTIGNQEDRAFRAFQTKTRTDFLSTSHPTYIGVGDNYSRLLFEGMIRYQILTTPQPYRNMQFVSFPMPTSSVPQQLPLRNYDAATVS